MSKRDIGKEILDGMEEIKAFKTGEGKLKTSTLSEPLPAKAAVPRKGQLKRC